MSEDNLEPFFQAVKNGRGFQEELTHLEHLLHLVKPKSDIQNLNGPLNSDDQDDCENSFLAQASGMQSSEGADGKTDPTNFPCQIWRDKNLLNGVTFYLFERRFGWSEQFELQAPSDTGRDLENSESATLMDMHKSKNVNSPRHSLSSPRNSLKGMIIEKESKYKEQLNDLLDEFLHL